ncbi:hypothetical protein D3C71_2017050 [compost metagenome]
MVDAGTLGQEPCQYPAIQIELAFRVKRPLEPHRKHRGQAIDRHTVDMAFSRAHGQAE